MSPIIETLIASALGITTMIGLRLAVVSAVRPVPEPAAAVVSEKQG